MPSLVCLPQRGKCEPPLYPAEPMRAASWLVWSLCQSTVAFRAVLLCQGLEIPQGLSPCAHPPGACFSPVLLQPLGPAPRVSSPVPMAAALLGAGNAMGTMTVQMAQTRCVRRAEGGREGRTTGVPRSDQDACPCAHRKTALPAVTWTSSSARVGTASPCAGAVMQMLTAWTAVTRKPVALAVRPSPHPHPTVWPSHSPHSLSPVVIS